MSRVHVRTGDFVLRRIADETILVPVSNEMADLDAVYTMGEVGRQIWEMIDGATTSHQIAQAIRERWKIDPDRAEADVNEFLASLEEAGLVTRKEEER